MKTYSQEELQDKKTLKKDLVGFVLQLQQERDALLGQAEPASTTEEATATAELGVLGTVVIPFKASAADGNELIYALRGWEENYPELQKVIIIGDTPNFALSDKVVVISHTSESDNPQIDVAHKMALAIASEEVPETFIWSNDDIYPTTHVLPADMLMLRANGLLQDSKGTNLYNKNRVNTINSLQKDELNIFDYATHSPVVFEKEKLAEVLEGYGCLETGHLISSLYFNTWYPKVFPILIDAGDKVREGNYVVSVKGQTTKVEVIAKHANRRKFLNNQPTGWPQTEKFLKERFKQKSSFEA